MKEETGLTLAWIIQEVGEGVHFETGRGNGLKKWYKITFLVEVDEIGAIEYAKHIQPAHGAMKHQPQDKEKNGTTEASNSHEDGSAADSDGASNDIDQPDDLDPNYKKHRPSQAALSESRPQDVPVKLSDDEHAAFLWTTEEEIEAERVEEEKLSFVSPDMKAVMLQAFDLQKEVMASKIPVQS